MNPFSKSLCRTAFLIALVSPATAPHVFAQAGYTPSPENLKSREWFEDARFGLFIHWGVYSVLGKGEWVMNNDKIAVADYEKLPERFNPTEFNPAEWVAMVKDAGMKYIDQSLWTILHDDWYRSKAVWGAKAN